MARVTSIRVEIAGERRADVTIEVSGGSESIEIQANAVQVDSNIWRHGDRQEPKAAQSK